MLRTAPLLLLLATASLLPALHAGDPYALPSDAEQLAKTFESIFNCKTEIYHRKISPKSRLKISKNGVETVNESLEDFDDLTVIVISGKGMGVFPADPNGPQGYQIRLIVSKDHPRSKTNEVTSRTLSVSYSEPAGEYSGMTLSVDTTPIFKRVDKTSGKDGVETSLIITTTPEEQTPAPGK